LIDILCADQNLLWTCCYYKYKFIFACSGKYIKKTLLTEFCLYFKIKGVYIVSFLDHTWIEITMQWFQNKDFVGVYQYCWLSLNPINTFGTLSSWKIKRKLSFQQLLLMSSRWDHTTLRYTINYKLLAPWVKENKQLASDIFQSINILKFFVCFIHQHHHWIFLTRGFELNVYFFLIKKRIELSEFY
jgi:hypothetical protein